MSAYPGKQPPPEEMDQLDYMACWNRLRQYIASMRKYDATHIDLHHLEDLFCGIESQVYRGESRG